MVTPLNESPKLNQRQTPETDQLGGLEAEPREGGEESGFRSPAGEQQARDEPQVSGAGGAADPAAAPPLLENQAHKDTTKDQAPRSREERRHSAPQQPRAEVQGPSHTSTKAWSSFLSHSRMGPDVDHRPKLSDEDGKRMDVTPLTSERVRVREA